MQESQESKRGKLIDVLCFIRGNCSAHVDGEARKLDKSGKSLNQIIVWRRSLFMCVVFSGSLELFIMIIFCYKNFEFNIKLEKNLWVVPSSCHTSTIVIITHIKIYSSTSWKLYGKFNNKKNARYVLSTRDDDWRLILTRFSCLSTRKFMGSTRYQWPYPSLEARGCQIHKIVIYLSYFSHFIFWFDNNSKFIEIAIGRE